jgi:glycosyltransferase involved in cell wall biosynthesis
MNIAIYYTPLASVCTPTGVGKHIVHMTGAMAALAAPPRLSLLATKGAYDASHGKLPAELARLPVSLMPGSEGLFRKLQTLTRFLPVDRWGGGADWIYCPKEQPVATRSAKLAVTVHDVLAFENEMAGVPLRPTLRKRLRWSLLMRAILKRADLIPVVSEFTRRRLLEVFGARLEKRIAVVGNGVSPIFFRSGDVTFDAAALERYAVSPAQYVVLVGSLTQRKGADVVLEFARLLRASRLPLKVVVAGRRHEAAFERIVRDAEASGEPLPVQLLGYVPDADLATLLSHALCLVCPSRYEGFGIPIVEAMAAGTPVVCSKIDALSEVGGDAPVYLSTLRAEEMHDKIQELLRSESVRGRLIANGRARAVQFTWERCAQRLVAAMSAAA